MPTRLQRPVASVRCHCVSLERAQGVVLCVCAPRETRRSLVLPLLWKRDVATFSEVKPLVHRNATVSHNHANGTTCTRTPPTQRAGALSLPPPA